MSGEIKYFGNPTAYGHDGKPLPHAIDVLVHRKGHSELRSMTVGEMLALSQAPDAPYPMSYTPLK
jgi:hypothetical protein